MRKTQFIPLAIFSVGLLALPACGPSLTRPQLNHPGPAQYQRARALQFDPYPPNDLAPEIVGGRPAGYAQPPNEVERARQHRPAGPWANPTPTTITPAPIPVGAPLY
ncbi:hypothetical protein [Adhaeretor mobilis]|uniref:Membrane or secreted protein n=1 Tax=Adhaeretor mobilis TaxID=1930276 RepID=A0A517MZA5_9BACT|nr:hypothetical protein [Adhaeretor mobilis]QDT00195.1 hypothetical protein HG15A2_35300 [Adhaeretor mobilis]